MHVRVVRIRLRSDPGSDVPRRHVGSGPRARHLPAIPAHLRPVTGSGIPEADPDDLTEDGHDFLDRYAELGDPADLRRARAAYEQALKVLPPGEPTWPFLSNLGNCLRMV